MLIIQNQMINCFPDLMVCPIVGTRYAVLLYAFETLKFLPLQLASSRTRRVSVS